MPAARRHALSCCQVAHVDFHLGTSPSREFLMLLSDHTTDGFEFFTNFPQFLSCRKEEYTS